MINRIKKELISLKSALEHFRIVRSNPSKIINNYSYERVSKEYKQWVSAEAYKLEKYRNIHLGEDCFIIGNGPSLNEMDLTKLNGYHVFGLNKIFLLLDKVDLSLDYLVSVNKHVIEQSIDQFIALPIPKFFAYYPDIIPENEHINLLFTNRPGFMGFHADITKGIYEGYTVTYIAMQLAYFMGFKQVFLIGVDHNFKQQGKANEEQKMEGDDPNHFDPNYFKGMKWNLADLEGSEMFYSLADFLFKRDGRKIWDATKGGKLHIFDKIDYNKALELAKVKEERK